MGASGDQLDRLDRRRFLALAAATLATARLGLEAAGTRVGAAPIVDYPFSLGVASGDPTSSSVVLWTRLAPDPLVADGGMAPGDVAVGWQLALDPSFTEVVSEGTEPAVAEFAHSVHVEPGGLQANTWYHYRFTVDGHVSAVGRTRTTPAWPDRTPLRLGSAACQAYTDGYYTAHAHLADEGCDLIAFLGDYIYEGGGSGLRAHTGGEADTLAKYRVRYALYKSDPDLQAAHASCPWVVIWDDHEVDNNYAGSQSEKGDDPAAFLVRRAAAYRAWWEHQPVRVEAPSGPDLTIYNRLAWGSLANLHLLDTRQYRSDQTCGDGLQKTCAGWDDPARTLLGTEQEAWLFDGLDEANVVWDVVAQQVVFAPMPIGAQMNMDQWDGYPSQRERVWEVLRQSANPVVLSGDIHFGGFVRLHETLTDESTPRVGTELVVGSIASLFGATSPTLAKYFIQLLGWWDHVNAADRGYMIVDFGEDSMTARLRVVSTTQETIATVRTAHSVTVAAVLVAAPPSSTTTTETTSPSSTASTTTATLPSSSTSAVPATSTTLPTSPTAVPLPAAPTYVG